MPLYQTPGVYFESSDIGRKGITAVRTDIAAFVGLAERGPLHLPWPVESWRQFQTLFGDFVPFGYLAYAVKAFFDNGGRRCYIVRVAAADARHASGDLVGMDGLPTLRIRANSPGRWGNKLQVRLAEAKSSATQTQGQPTGDGATSVVDSIVGFQVGTLVRLFQHNGSGTIEAYRAITSVDPVGRSFRWDAALKLAPSFAGDPVFNLTQPIELESVAFTLSVYEQGRLRAIYDDLSIVPFHTRYAPAVINMNLADPEDRRQALPLIQIDDLHAGATPPQWGDWLPDANAATASFQQGVLSLQCGMDGLTALTAQDFTGDPSADQRTGLRTLELEPEVALVAVPDILIQPLPPVRRDPTPPPKFNLCIESPPPPAPLPLPPLLCPDVEEQPPTFDTTDIALVQQAVVLHCQTLADRFALLDPLPPSDTNFDPSLVLQWRYQFDSSYAALYYPWVLVPDPLQLGGQVVRAVPPSGHVAGVMARTDTTLGVHVAPANAVLEWTQGFTEDVSAEWQAILNPAHVNCLRALPGHGLRVYGARTVSSEALLRFVNVRRTLLMIEKALDLSLQWTVFEPHDVLLRQSVSLVIASFLTALWQQGALAGRDPEQAFFVRCDDVNNPPDVVALGQLIVDVGVAIVHPSEFVVVRINRAREELMITEPSGVTT